MKILSITHSPNYSLNKSQRQNYASYNTNVDTFYRTTSFKGGVPKVIRVTAKKLVENPSKLLSGAGFAAAFFAALHALANGEEISDSNAAEFAAEKFVESETEQLQENIEESKEEDNEVYLIGQKPIHPEEETKSAEGADNSKQDETVTKKHIVLPRRKGSLSAQEDALKNIAEKINDISEDAEQKLQEIWKNIISKGYESDEQRKSASKDELALRKEQSNTLAENIANGLSKNIENREKVEEYIDDIYNELFAEKVINNNLKKNRLKVLGTIMLPEKSLTYKDCLNISEVYKENSDDLIFKIPNANDKYSLPQMLKMMLIQFEKNISNNDEDFIKWMYNQPVSKNIKPSEITDEIIKQNNKEDANSRPYTNIKIDDADVVADVINGEKRFSNIFSTHAAVRFFERFIDFEGENIEKQCKEKLDALENLIKITEQKEGIKLEKYPEKDSKGKEIVGLRITLYPAKYGTEFVQKLGSFPIRIGICENQSADYYQKRNKQPLIKTIWPVGL